MKSAESIAERLPHFYMSWDRTTAVSSILEAVGKSMDEAEGDFIAVMTSRWVDTAKEEDVDKLGAIYCVERMPGESDPEFRGRLKTSIISYMGGGTLSSLRMTVRIALGLPPDHPVEIVENPPAVMKKTWTVAANGEWTVDPVNTGDSVPEITITPATENATISDPTIQNLDTGQSITFNGKLAYGDVLTISDGKAVLNGRDRTDKLSSKTVPSLPRKTTRWRYTEAIGANIGVFDSAYFDKSVFAVDIATSITFEWTAYQPAAFEVVLPKSLLDRSGASADYVREMVNTVKACGVKGEVRVT